MGTPPTAHLVSKPKAPVSYRDLVTSLEIILVLAGVPLAIMALLGLLTLRSTFARPRRYRPGDAWDYPAVLWTAHPEAMRGGTAHHTSSPRSGGSRGGAHGNW
ncbi:MAG TPA: hypothetical protein VFO16_23220 [Pseudonocardiaceae bacterium]|nr:hypothetical protein [Pseudonocardiaceae bacterium]